MTFRPNIIELKKYRPVSGRLELRHVHESPRIVIKIGFNSQEVHGFYSKLLASDIEKLYCDGDYFLMYDNFGTQYIHINSIKTCVDEEGVVVAHSVGMSPLSDKDISASSKYIDENRKPITASPVINDSRPEAKIVNPKAGFFSPKLQTATVTK